VCGIAGFVDFSKEPRKREEMAGVVGRMTATLRHRGPDDEGVWVDEKAGIALGHRRLSIIDLSPEGHQPMHSACGRYVVVFNGEIYNYRQVRDEIEKDAREGRIGWRGHSDTEVMLAAISRWGLEGALERFNGMFAFALWDRETRTLHLVRDRLGEKPLYYGRVGDRFLFGSELKALRAHPDGRFQIDRGALSLFLRHNYVPSPYSIYENVFKLPPGASLSVARERPGDSRRPVSYWEGKKAVEEGIQSPFTGTEGEALARFESLLQDSVSMRMESDVPLGAFLSGGIDSSTVVALMQAQSGRPVRTFTVGFSEKGFDEARHARAVATHLGTDHTEVYVTPQEALAVIPSLPSLYDEPFADSSQIPTFLVAQVARRHVTVSLSGDGGDELFGGYNRYTWGRRIWRTIGWVPRRIRKTGASMLTAVAPGTWDGLFEKMAPALPARVRHRTPGDKLHKLGGVLAAEDPATLYLHLVSHWKDPSQVVLGGFEPPTAMSEPGDWAGGLDFTGRMMYLDMVTYLPDDILTKVDRASMGVGLEARVPFLDHRVVEFAWRLPRSMKIRDGRGKWLLRQILHRHVPAELVDRPKMGFGVPIEAWLRDPLRDWAESLLDEERLRREGFLNPEPIRLKWREHLSGRRNWQYYLWDVLMFQAWLESQRPS
jgi:asparagine synthase (glutamine-hydrolysing)